jgi:thioesterase domain-containing protein
MPVAALRDAEEFFHTKIPLTRAIGLRVVAASDGSFAVEAPVALNYNHLHTAFGGSINAVATLAAYGFLWLELRDSAVEIVVAESTIRFLVPVRKTIRAVCAPPMAEVLANFRAMLGAKGKARIALHVAVAENERVAAAFDGMFVAVSPGMGQTAVR